MVFSPRLLVGIKNQSNFLTNWSNGRLRTGLVQVQFGGQFRVQLEVQFCAFGQDQHGALERNGELPVTQMS